LLSFTKIGPAFGSTSWLMGPYSSKLYITLIYLFFVKSVNFGKEDQERLTMKKKIKRGLQVVSKQGL
jgi:hypothetical protein